MDYKSEAFANTCKNLEKDGWEQFDYQTGKHILFHVEIAKYKHKDNASYYLLVDPKGRTSIQFYEEALPKKENWELSKNELCKRLAFCEGALYAHEGKWPEYK